jgi:hypothetical protein
MFWRTRSNIEPCLPRPAKEPPVGSGWIHEIKHDGFRNFRDYSNARSRWLVRRPALEIDLQARTVNGMPITQLSDTQIAAATGRVQLERDIEANTTWFIDRAGGHLQVMATVKPVTCQQMSLANVWDMVYDCASAKPGSRSDS